MTTTSLITEAQPAPAPSSMAQRLVAAGHRYVFPSSTSETGRSKVIRGTAWVLGGTAASQALRAASTIILARWFIGPGEFGLVSLVTVFISGLSLLSDLGVGTDVIRHPRGDEPIFLDTAFLIQLGRGLSLYALAAVLAWPFASIYRQPKLGWLVIAASMQIMVQGVTSSSIWTLTRNVENDKLTLLNVSSDLAGLIVSVAWAAISPTAWALVAGILARAMTNMLGSHLLARRRFRLEWDRNAARDILSFGAGMFLSSVTFFFVTEAERLVVARFITVAELGCFSLALTVSAMPGQAFSQVIGKVFLPMIAKTAHNNADRAADHYSKMRQLLLALCVCFSIGFIAFGPIIVRVVLGPKYVEAGWMVQLLGFRAAFQLFSGAAATMLFALGYSRYAAIGNAVRLAFLSAGLAVAFTYFGFRQAVWVLALSQVAAHAPLLFGIRSHFRAALRTEIQYSAVLLGASLLTAVLIREWHPAWNSIHLWTANRL
jgi:O-antigen/teichoic acid export membrane protein